MKNNSYWKDTIKFINNKKVDNKYNFYYNTFTPLNIKNTIYGYGYGGQTIHSYIRILVILGFIVRIEQGKYIKMKDIPETLSYNTAKKFAYSYDEKILKRYFKIQMIKEKIKQNINI